MDININSEEDIVKRIPQYKWFSHVDFGHGIIAKSTSWPDAPLDSRHMGVGKFEFIVRRNLPDLKGKRILDIGCNAGIIALHMLDLGASEVVGIDSEKCWPNWKEQAYFVKSVFEWRNNRKYNVIYIEADMRGTPSLRLGSFDAVIALNSLYYLVEEDIARVVRHLSRISDSLLVQCNTRDHKHLGKRPTPKFMQQVLVKNGFSNTCLDWPWDQPRRGFIPQKYHRPVVVGKRD